MKHGVYRIKNISNNDCYIGSSLNFKERKRRHFRDLEKGKHHSIVLQRAFNKYGRDEFEFEILETGIDRNELLQREQYFIDTLNPKYNICSIAGSPLGVKHSKESNEKKRKYALENNVLPPSSTWENKRIPVIMLDYTTSKVIRQFESISEACLFIGKDSSFASTIISCCNNKRYSAYGYRWVYQEEDIKSLRKKEELVAWNKGKRIRGTRMRKVKQYNLEMEYIREWESVKEAEKVYGKGISNCALGKSKTSNGYIWKY